MKHSPSDEVKTEVQFYSLILLITVVRHFTTRAGRMSRALMVMMKAAPCIDSVSK